jgi:aspartate/methionine/tyrosine aminotransferase
MQNQFCHLQAGDNTNLLAVHSLSKRSNLAGYRAGFIVGDSKLIAQIREIRKHAGMMVPLPVQKAMVAALSDQKHVIEQANKYQMRREVLKTALEKSGFKLKFSEAGYISGALVMRIAGALLIGLPSGEF